MGREPRANKLGLARAGELLERWTILSLIRALSSSGSLLIISESLDDIWVMRHARESQDRTFASAVPST